MLCNGYGEHNIQGIGDKHIPLIHNVMNTDVVVGVSDHATDSLNVLFGGNVGRSYLVGRQQDRSRCGTDLRRHRHLGTCQHRCRHQDRQASRSRRRRRDHDGRDRQRRALRQRAAELSGAALSRRLRRGECRRDLQPPSAGRRRRPRARAHPFRSQTRSSTSAISPGWSSRACRSTISTGARTSGSGARCGYHPGMGPPDRGVQRGGRRRARPRRA